MDAETSTPRSHVAVHKLDVARARLRYQITKSLDAEDYATAIRFIHQLDGLGTAIDVLLAPDASFSEP